MTTALAPRHSAGAAFDTIAGEYDDIFTFSSIGRAQREVVWQRALNAFAAGHRILELNCGTGEDALFLSRQGIDVTACDASAEMIARAMARKRAEAPDASVEFRVLATEDMDTLALNASYDGAFSNFSGLNCIADLRGVSDELAKRLRPGARVLFCVSTRFCLWEFMCYASRGDLRKAFRRLSGRSQARLKATSFPVYYPSLRSLRRTFCRHFRVLAVTGIGIAVPPSYLEEWAAAHPRMLQWMRRFDRTVCDWPIFRTLGDHLLLSMEKYRS